MVRQLSLVTGSKVLNSALSFAFGAVVARLLGPRDYGFLAFSFAVTAIASELTGYGLEATLVRMTASTDPTGHEQRAIYRLVFQAKLLVNSVMMIAGWFAADPLAEALGDPGYAVAIRLGTVGSLGFSAWRLTLAILQSTQSFGRYALVQSVGGIAKIAGLLVLVLSSRLELSLILLVHVGSFFVGFAVGTGFLPRRTLSVSGPITEKTRSTVFHYAKWILAGSFLNILSAWLGVPLLGWLLTPQAVGHYAAAHMLVRALDILTVSLDTVLLPAACRVETRAEALGYLRRTISISALVSLAIAPLYVFADRVIVLLYSASFSAAVPAYRILFWGLLLTLYVHPAVLLLHSRNRPGLITGLEGAALAVTLAAAFWLIPAHAINGAAWATTLGRLVAALAGIAIVYSLVFSRRGLR